MGRDLKSMSIRELIEEVGCAVSVKNMYSVVLPEFTEELDEYYRKNDFENKDIMDFLIKNEKKINKEIFVMCTLYNYMREKEKNPEKPEYTYYIDMQIEKCKKMLEGKSASLYDRIIDSKTGKLTKITETTSEELCAHNDLNSYSTKKDELNLEKRKSTYKKRLEKKSKKKEENLERFEKIRKNFAPFLDMIIASGLGIEDEKGPKTTSLSVVLQMLLLTDLEDVICKDKQFGALMRYQIMRNTLLELGFTQEDIEDLDSEEMQSRLDEIEFQKYMPEFERAMEMYADYISVDKLLLCSAFRIIESLENHIFTPEENMILEKLLETIVNTIENPNARIKSLIIAKDEDVEANLDISAKDCKNFLNGFTKDGLYIGDAYIENIKMKLFSNEIKFEEIDIEVMSQLNLNLEETIEIIKKSKENFLYLINNSKMKDEVLQIFLAEFEELDTDIVSVLLEKELIRQTDIEIFLANNQMTSSQIMELAEKNIVEENTLIYLYNRGKKNKELDDKYKLKSEELLEYFNIEKIEEYIKENKISPKFLIFYKELLSEEAEKRVELITNINKLLDENNNKQASKEFYLAGIISIDNLTGKLAEEDIINMFEQKEIDSKQLIKMYNKDLIDETSMSLLTEEYELSEDLLEELDNLELSPEKLIKVEIDIKENYIYGRYMQKENSFNTQYPAIIGLANGNVTIEQLDKLYNLGKVKEDDLFEFAKKGFFDQKTVRDIYINSLISDEKLEQLCADGIISEKSKELAKKSRNMGQLSKNIDKKLGMHIHEDGIEIDDRIILPMEKKGEKIERDIDIYTDGTTKFPKLKKVTEPAIRDEKIKALGGKRIKRECVEYDEKSPFNDYEFYIIPTEVGEINPDCIVIAERYYKDKFSYDEELIDGNATYLFKLGDLTRISKKSKPEIISLMQQQKDKSMTRLSHTKYWSKNLDQAIESIMGKNMKSKYTPKELKKIDTINELIDGFEDPTNNNDYTRPFDVYFY